MKTPFNPLLALALCPPAIAESKLLKFDPPLEASSGVRQDIERVNYIYEIRIFSQFKKRGKQTSCGTHATNAMATQTELSGIGKRTVMNPRWTGS